MRSFLVVLIGMLVLNPIVGPAPESPPVAPTDIAYCVTQGTTRYTVHPVSLSETVTSFYDYSSASAHTPYVEAYASVLYLYEDTHIAGQVALYLVFHFNVDNGGSPNAATTVSLTGIPASAGAALSDDPGQGAFAEFYLGRFPQGDFNYFLNTDGGVLGPLPTTSDWQINVTIAHGGSDPMRTQKWVDADSTRLPLATSGTIRIATICNQAPTASPGGPYTGLEGSPVTFNAGGSSDPDGDLLTYVWDFEDDGTADATTTSATIQHTYPDDFAGKARLTVSDGTEKDSATVDVSIANVAPSVLIDSLTPAPEGEGTVLQLRITDPGTDAVVVEFDAGDTQGPYFVGTLFHPTDFQLPVPVTWGDDGLYPVLVTAKDDDGGVGEAGAIATVTNTVPGIAAVTNPSATTYGEGDETDVDLRARDPGSDDLRIEVDFGNGDLQSAAFFNDGVGPDPDPSPLGTYPFEATQRFVTRYVDDGTYTMRITATDDDGGSATVSFDITVVNVAPTILPFGPGLAVEGSGGALSATATDPGNDALSFSWEFELLVPFSESFAPGGSPTTATSSATFLYGDDGTYAVRLTVTDDDGGSAVFETAVAVANLAPTVQITQVHRPASFVLRVAGEKWHDVRATFYENSEETDSLGVVRTPGSPDEQAASTAPRDLNFSSTYAAKVLYTPEDDPVNGQPNGANPVWIILRTEDGQEVRVHHTFNVEHPGTYVWDVDLTPYVAQVAVRFFASARDPGSDDLQFHWDFGDGTTVDRTDFNNGAFADPAKSPDGTFPFTATDEVAHVFASPGTYTITLTVTDDDGGTGTATFVVTILG